MRKVWLSFSEPNLHSAAFEQILANLRTYPPWPAPDNDTVARSPVQ